MFRKTKALYLLFMINFDYIFVLGNEINGKSNRMKDTMIEKVKDQILKELALKSLPKSTKSKPVLQTLYQFPDAMDNIKLSDDNSTPNIQSFVIFSEIDLYTYEISGKLRFRFKVPTNFNFDDVVSLELWLFKDNYYDGLRLTQYSYNTNVIIQSLTISHQGENFGWIRFEVFPMIRMSLIDYGNTNLDIEIECYGVRRCTGEVVSVEDKTKPFLVVNHMTNFDKVSRVSNAAEHKIDCAQGQTTCCTEQLYVSFDEIELGVVIIAPRGYSAKYCKGSCTNEVNLRRYPMYTAVIDAFIAKDRKAAETMGLKITCVPSKLSSLPLVYQLPSGNTIDKSVPDMVVESCDCV